MQRDLYIDFLRAFGLLMLVVAHTNAPSWIFAFRTFDVPLMVFVSALCYKPLMGGGISIHLETIQENLYSGKHLLGSLFHS